MTPSRVATWLFPPVSKERLGFFRIAFGLAMLCNQSITLPRWREFFGPQADVSIDFVLRASSVPAWLIADGSIVDIRLTCLVLVAATLCFTLGLWSRIMAPIIGVGLMLLQNRNPYILYGGDRVILCILVLATCLDLDGAFALRRRIRSGTAWSLRLIQWQLALIYLFAGISKLSSSDWMSGQFVFSMVSYPLRSHLPLTWLHDFPIVINIATVGALAAELAYAFLVWAAPTRLIMVALMATLHAGIFLTYSVNYFSLIMIAVLPLALNDDEHAVMRRALVSPVRALHAMIARVRADLLKTNPRAALLLAGVAAIAGLNLLNNMPASQLAIAVAPVEQVARRLRLTSSPWSMFAQEPQSARETRIAYDDRIEPVKGTAMPPRRSPWNEVLEQVLDGRYGDGVEARRRYAAFRCRDGYDGRAVSNVRFEQRRWPIASALRGENPGGAADRFDVVAAFRCKELL